MRVHLAVLCAGADYSLLGTTIADARITVGGANISLSDALRAWQEPLGEVFPDRLEDSGQALPNIDYSGRSTVRPAKSVVKPRVLIPVFPGTNCEFDSASAFEAAGAQTEVLVLRNLTPSAVQESLDALAAAIERVQIIMLAGGFSAGDEPDGSGKFITAALSSPRVKAAVESLLNKRDGLMLGICNGFQALVKLGLVPYGDIRPLTADSPTLTYNTVGRHISAMVQTRITSTLSPWLANVEVGDIHTVAISHGEGRFIAEPAMLEMLIKNGQIATQYVDTDGQAVMANAFNPNGAAYAIEAITSPDGRVLGKMAHSERIGTAVGINIPGNKDQGIFAAGVKYFG